MTNPLDFLWGDSEGEVPSVDPADLQAICKMSAGPSGGCVDMRLFESTCSPGADVRSVWFRASMLQLLSAIHSVKLTDSAFKVAATFPMKKTPIGVPQQGLPFDVQGFISQIASSEPPSDR